MRCSFVEKDLVCSEPHDFLIVWKCDYTNNNEGTIVIVCMYTDGSIVKVLYCPYYMHVDTVHACTLIIIMMALGTIIVITCMYTVTHYMHVH